MIQVFRSRLLCWIKTGYFTQLQSDAAAPDVVAITEAERGAAVFTQGQRLSLLLAFVALLMLRLPQAWLHGRFMGEEGTIFLAYAWHRPAALALWRSFAGYLNLGANASTLMVVELVRSGMLSLELAPRITMAVATLFQAIPAMLILTGRGRWLSSRWSVVACLLIIAISPATEEVFANVLHIQFHLALACGLILALDIPASRLGRAVYWIPLGLAPLCGPGAIVLMPIFALRALVDKDRARLAQTLVLGAGTMLQMLVFYTHSSARGHFLDPATLVNLMFVRFAAMAYFSAFGGQFVGKGFYTLYQTGGWGWWCATAVSFLYFAWLVREALRDRNDAAPWLVLSGLALAVVSFGVGMLQTNPTLWFSVGGSERYNFLPATFLGVGLVALAMRQSSKAGRVYRVLCLLLLLSGMITFFAPGRYLREGPDWSAEVRHWRQDHAYQLASWPKRWVVDLSDGDRPCSPVAAASTPSTDPTYCESSWLEWSRAEGNQRAAWIKPKR